MTTTLDADDIATDADLAIEVGGSSQLSNLIPADWSGSAKKARQAALEDMMRALRKRTPPVTEADLMDATELKSGVVYGACERLYRVAMTTPDSVYATHRKLYAERFDEELDGFTPTLSEGERGGPTSFVIERR